MFSHLHLTMNSTGTNQGFGCTLSHSICWNSFNPSALTYPRSYMSNNHTIPSNHIMCGHLVWHSKHPLGSHIWNTRQWEHYSYRDLNLSHFVWTMYRCSCPFQVLVDYDRYWLLKQKWPIENHSFLLHLVKELHCLLTSPALSCVPSLVFHKELSNFTVPDPIATSSASTHGGLDWPFN